MFDNIKKRIKGAVLGWKHQWNGKVNVVVPKPTARPLHIEVNRKPLKKVACSRKINKERYEVDEHYRKMCYDDMAVRIAETILPFLAIAPMYDEDTGEAELQTSIYIQV